MRRKVVRKTKQKAVPLNHVSLIGVFLGIVLVAGVVLQLSGMWDFVSAANGKKLVAITKKHSKHVCDLPSQAKRVRCNAEVVTDDNLNPVATNSPASSSYGPTQLHTAYNLPCTPGGPVQSPCATPTTFGPTVAIVIAYHTPTIENDLQVFSNYYNLPSCTQTNGCLEIIDQNGGTSLPGTVDQNWSLEAALDVQTVHSICQTCKIVLIEANSNTIDNLGTAVNTASKLGVVAISNSYAGSEFSGENFYDTYYNHPGIAVVAGSGDWGYGPYYPAAVPGVVSVGGTTLSLYTDNTYAGETVWNSNGYSTGSGCSNYESALSEQVSLANWSQTGCGTKRAISDVSANADPNTGVAIYSSTPYSGQIGWWQMGGTSLATPIISGVFALVNNLPADTQAPSVLYHNYNLSNFHDITSGSNGSCGTIMCTGASGYDGPTGLGSPNGLVGFGGTAVVTQSPSDTPVLTPTNTPTPTSVSAIPPVMLSASPALTNSCCTIVVSFKGARMAQPISKYFLYINGNNFTTLTATGNTGDNTNATYTYNQFQGTPFTTYNFSVKAVDNLGNLSPESNVISATTLGVKMYISNLQLSSTTSRKGVMQVTTTVTVLNGSGKGVPSASVQGTLTYPSGRVDSLSGTTGAKGSSTGKVTFTKTVSEKGTYTVNITNVTKSGYSYDSASSKTSGTVSVQ